MKKSNPSIKQAVLHEFELLPQTFRGHDLIKVVKLVIGRKFVYSDSILRKMRCLKAEGKINYELADAKFESLYHKLS
jgi:hypothetical protein